MEILDTQAHFDPFREQVSGRYSVGEESPAPENFSEADLTFPSGVDLPCHWPDPHYRD